LESKKPLIKLSLAWNNYGISGYPGVFHSCFKKKLFYCKIEMFLARKSKHSEGRKIPGQEEFYQ
jgi:hypothetical protein